MSEPIVRGVVVDRPSAWRGGDPERPVRITVADAAYADLTPHEARTVAAALEMEAATAGPTGDASAPTDPGEGRRTGTGGPDAPGASEGLAAAIEAATKAIEAAADEWNASGKGDITLMEAEAEYYDLPGVRADDGEPFARVAVRAAYPLIRRTIAEQIARRIEAEYADTGSDHDAGLFNAAEIAREVGRGE